MGNKTTQTGGKLDFTDQVFVKKKKSKESKWGQMDKKGKLD